ncbi:MAG: hypothetical protein ABIJ16_10440 [Bacteroidota bacterium]
MNRNLFLLLAGILLSAAAFSQPDTIRKDINIIDKYNPTISDANKIKFFPEIIDSTKTDNTFNYGIKSRPINVNFELEPIKPAKLEGEPLTKLYRSLIKLGYGNYFSPFAEIYYNNLRSKKQSVGAYYNHISSDGKLKTDKGKTYAGYSDNSAGVYLKKFLDKKKTFTGNIDFGRNVFYNYGITPYVTSIDLDKEDMEKRWLMRMDADLKLKNNHADSSHFNFDTGLGFKYTRDNSEYGEKEFGGCGTFSKFYGDELMGLTTDIRIYDYDYKDASGMKGLVIINPWASIVGDEWRIETGLNFTADAYGDSLFYHIYPKVQLQYNVIENFMIPYAGFDGKLQYNNYRSIAYENHFINPGLSVKNTSYPVVLYGGIRGNFTQNLNYNFQASYSVIEDMYFYVNDTIDHAGSSFFSLYKGIQTLNTFSVVYDDVEMFRLHGEVVYKKTDKWNFILRGNYYSYKLSNELYAWHKPDFDASMTVEYNLRDKILLNAEIFSIGNRNARFTLKEEDVTFELDPIIDANLGIEYRYSKILSGFIYINNITSKNYNIWYGYPVQGINFIFGLSYSL